MPKQLITITLTAEAYAESFEILKVFHSYDDELIVVSRLDIPVIGDEAINDLTAEVEVDVPYTMPVKHYIIGLYEEYNKDWLPKETFAMIDQESEIPLEERTNCIYTKPASLRLTRGVPHAVAEEYEEEEESSSTYRWCI